VLLSLLSPHLTSNFVDIRSGKRIFIRPNKKGKGRKSKQDGIEAQRSRRRAVALSAVPVSRIEMRTIGIQYHGFWHNGLFHVLSQFVFPSSGQASSLINFRTELEHFNIPWTFMLVCFPSRPRIDYSKLIWKHSSSPSP